MKKISSAINVFCYKHPRFGIPRLMMYIVALSALAYIIGMMDTTYSFLSLLELMPDRVLKGEIWRVISWIFVPSASGIIWVAISLYFYYFIGSTLEQSWGPGKLTIYYATGIVLNVVYSLLVYVFRVAYVMPSSMFLNLSMFFAFASMYPDTQIRIMFILPVKIKWLAWLNAAFYAYEILMHLSVRAYFYALVPVVAVLNFIIICGIPKPRIRTAKQRKTATNFKRNVQNHENYTTFEYRHKCTVCDRTDKTDPELEFRYCSRCEGFKCYCEKHIENHTHS